MKMMTKFMIISLLFTVDFTLYEINKQLYHAYDCDTFYNYVDMAGNKGISKNCYKENEEFFCRDTKKIVKVLDFFKEEVCEK